MSAPTIDEALESLAAARERLEDYDPLPPDAVADPELEHLAGEVRHALRTVSRLRGVAEPSHPGTVVDPFVAIKGVDWSRGRS